MPPAKRNPNSNGNPENISPLKAKKEDNMGPVFSVMAISYFVSTIFALGVFGVTFISFYVLSKVFAICLAIAFAIPLKLYRKKLTMSIYGYILFNIIGVAPFLVFLFLGTNYIGGATYQEKYEVVRIKREARMIRVYLKDAALEEHPFALEVKGVTLKTLHPKTLELTLSDGLWGFKVLHDQALY